jgi:glycosyltransferase
MKFSIITATLNCKETIEQTICSVLNQAYKKREHIIIDGGSKDGTIEILEKYDQIIKKIISEPPQGIYFALNEGLKEASGDVIGFLHGDDFYAHNNILGTVADVFSKEDVDSCYGDLEYIGRSDEKRVVRHWKSSEFRHRKFKIGWMPPHPTFFAKREVYEKYGYFNTNFRIAADYELMLRFLQKHRISTYYIPEVLIKMRLGGTSNRSIKNIFIKSSEDYRAWKINNLNGGLFTVFLKNISKVPQFFVRGNTN